MSPERAERDDADAAILARAQARARSAWVAAQHLDDATTRVASEERLMAAWPQPRVLPARSFALGMAVAAGVAAIAFGVWRGASASASATVASAAPPVPVSAPSTSTSTSTSTSGTVVFAGACPDCRVDGVALEPGGTLAVGRSVNVPRGARVTLGFALTGALMDPLVGVDLEGPAVARAADERSITLERGSARFRGLRDVTLSIPGARVVANGATFSVSVDARNVSHVAVERGQVTITSLASDAVHTLQTGGAMDFRPTETPAEPVVARAAVATAAAPSADRPTSAVPADSLAAVTNARTMFHEGDRAGARAQLEALAQSHDASVARRASFTLAEIEMADGERDKGRARLLTLATCPDARLAADASTLLARTEPTPAARAETWARYLATNPPAAYRERALLERAEALFDAGRPQDANAIVAELRTLPLSEAHQRQLERLAYKARTIR